MIETQVEPLAAATTRAGRTRALGRFLPDARLRGSRQFAVPALRSRQQPVVTDPPEALGNHVPNEGAQERRCAHRHFLGLSSVLVVLPIESHRPLLLVDALDALVAHRDAAGVTRQISHHGPGVAQGCAAENVPVASGELETPVAACLQRFKPLRPADLGVGFQRLDAPQQDRSEHFRHGSDRKQIVVPRLPPSTRRAVPPARADEHMQVRMPVERAAPGMEHREEPAFHPPVVLLEQLEGFGRAGEQLGRSDLIVQLEKSVQFLRHGEHHMEMRTVRQPLADLLRPFRLPRPQTVRAVAVATGAGIPFPVLTAAAFGLVVSQGAFAAMGHEIECRILLLAQSSGPEVAPFA